MAASSILFSISLPHFRSLKTIPSPLNSTKAPPHSHLCNLRDFASTKSLMAFLQIAVSCPFLILIFWATLSALILPFANADGALDAESLLALKSSVTQDPLSVLEDWQPNASGNACNWTGVTCSLTNPGRVVMIDLSNRQLAGQISPNIGNLSYLQVLNLSSNAFFGSMPPSLGRLQRLRKLHFGGNGLNGTIPPLLGNLSCLRFLNLSDNDLRGGIPSSLGQLSDLEELRLYNNTFLGGPIPPSLQGLKKLKEFLSYNNGHTGHCPLAFCNCSRLLKLELDGNYLRGTIPGCLGSLSELRWLNLARNSLQGDIPQSIWNLTALQVLYLGENNLTGSLPASLGKLVRLQRLSLIFNSFVGRILEHLANCTALTLLDLTNNQLSGELPIWLGRLSNLKWLSLSKNKFTGNIPDSLKYCTKLQNLQLQENHLHGIIPSWIGQLSQLNALRLYSNNFVGGSSDPLEPIAAVKMLYNCSYLRVLELDFNFLHGILPWDMGRHWPLISILSLAGCKISGYIPESIGNLSSLLVLDLSGNLFSGTIPYSWGNMKRIQYLSLAVNRLSGGIPWQITLLNRSLAYLYIDNNKLSGHLPYFIGNLASLQILDLRSNSFFGRIPPQLGNCKNLLSLHLSSNKFSGSIPPEVVDLKHIQKWFDLSRNSLTGDVPAEIEGLNMAEQIDLSQNQLRGNIGYWIDQWLNAKYINISFNNFSGQLPKSLFNLSQLVHLDVSHNNFQGRVPCSFASTKHSKFSLAHNTQLCGDCFSLPKCKTHKHQGRPTTLQICMLIGGLVLSFCIVLLILKRKVMTSSVTKMRREFLWVSPEEIQVATENFNMANVIGQGQHGTVYRGTFQGGYNVAIKIFSVLDSNSVAFTRECQTIGKVRHRNLIRIITACCTIELKALVLPLMPINLHKLLHEAKVDVKFSNNLLNLQIRLRILQELAAALSYLHHDCDPCIVHCDVKPQNVLLDEEMTVHLSDFGIACLLHQGFISATSSTTTIGSLGYIPPEYGATGRILAKGDVYSFGIVVLEVLTGLMPIDPMFKGNLTLSKWISTVFLGNLEEKEERRKRLKRMAAKGKRGIGRNIENEEEWMTLEELMQVGLICSSERPEQRPNMRDVHGMLCSISSKFYERENEN